MGFQVIGNPATEVEDTITFDKASLEPPVYNFPNPVKDSVVSVLIFTILDFSGIVKEDLEVHEDIVYKVLPPTFLSIKGTNLLSASPEPNDSNAFYKDIPD